MKGQTVTLPAAFPMRVSRLQPRDAEAYRDLMLEAYLHHPDAFTSSYDERQVLDIAWWRSRLATDEDATDVVFGVKSSQSGTEQLAGVAGIAYGTREKLKHKATLFGMYVADRHRRHGLGRLLLDTVLQDARLRAGVRILQLTVTSGNIAAQTLYEHGGFQRFGTEPFAIRVGSRFVDKVHMWVSLDAMEQLNR